MPGGTTTVGAEGEYPEEAPVRTVEVAPFRLERHPVTVAQFAAFVADTGYRTRAERTPDPEDLPGLDPRLRLPGALVFVPAAGPVPVTPTPADPEPWRAWWRFVPGASWHHPLGPLAGLDAREALPDHPVVQVCAEDAQAYADWAGRRLPAADELEHAARAGRPRARYAWGEAAEPGRWTEAVTWRGAFPHTEARFTGDDGVPGPATRAQRRHGWVGTAPVGTAAPNPWGLTDLIGNVWEWTATRFDAREAGDVGDVAYGDAERGEAERRDVGTAAGPPSPCCGGRGRPAGPRFPGLVVKGGSHLCAPEYCHRYRPAALQRQTADSATTHLGFRCAV